MPGPFGKTKESDRDSYCLSVEKQLGKIIKKSNLGDYDKGLYYDFQKTFSLTLENALSRAKAWSEDLKNTRPSGIPDGLENQTQMHLLVDYLRM